MTRMSRTLLAVSASLAVLVPAAPALAATTTGYSQTPTAPNTTTTTTTTGYQQTPTKPSSGTGPSQETGTPTSGTEPTKTSTTPSTATKASAGKTTLPFTGLDLRWVLVVGLLLLAAGVSIRVLQRRQGTGR